MRSALFGIYFVTSFPVLLHELQCRLGALHILFNRSAADANRADDVAVDFDRIAAAEGCHARARRYTRDQGGIALDEVEKFMGRKAEQRGVGLALRDLDRNQSRAVHAHECLQISAIVNDGHALRNLEFAGLCDRRLDQLLGELRGDCMFLVSLAHCESLHGLRRGASSFRAGESTAQSIGIYPYCESVERRPAVNSSLISI